MKYLRRQTIIRELDFNKKILAVVPLLYNRAEFTPIRAIELERDHVFKILKRNSLLDNQILAVDFGDPKDILRHYKDYLYNRRYQEWRANMDNQGQIWIQSRQDYKPSILGWAVLEHWYE